MFGGHLSGKAQEKGNCTQSQPLCRSCSTIVQYYPKNGVVKPCYTCACLCALVLVLVIDYPWSNSLNTVWVRSCDAKAGQVGTPKRRCSKPSGVQQIYHRSSQGQYEVGMLICCIGFDACVL